MKLTGVSLRRVRLPLVAPFRTSFGVETERDILLVNVTTPDTEGWGECVAMSEPLYSSEYVDGAQHVTRNHLVPRLLAAGDVTAAAVAGLLAPVKGHRMVKAAVETAVLDAGEAWSPITFIRRATFDLVGLPPTPDEVHAFVNDRSPEAFRKVVDRLLESPHYGERWARHWRRRTLMLIRFPGCSAYSGKTSVPSCPSSAWEASSLRACRSALACRRGWPLRW